MRILCTGDVHIGRRPSKVPEADAKEYSCAAAWSRIVRTAIDERCKLLLLSGDVIDRSDRYFEAFGIFQDGLAKLAGAEILTVAVAGNHDFDTFPRLIHDIRPENFVQLGAGGAWQSHTFEIDGEPIVRIDGWSFPTEHVYFDPLASYVRKKSNLPVIGLLHADLNVPGSRYAPVTSVGLSAADADIWVLGHTHVPTLSALPSGKPYLYPGSPQGMHPGEPGFHGPWIIETDNLPQLCQVSPAPLRYDEAVFDASVIVSLHDFQPVITEAVRAQLEVLRAGAVAPSLLTLRLVGQGRSRDRSVLERGREMLMRDDREVSFGETRVCIQSISLANVLPDYDLADLARESTPPGRVARLIAALQTGERTSDVLNVLAEARRRIEAVNNVAAYQALIEDRPPRGDGDDQAAELVLQEAFRLLDALMAQKDQVVA